MALHHRWGGTWSIRQWSQQKLQVPKMEGLNLIRLFWGWVLPYISLTYSLSKVSTSILGTWNVWWWRVQKNSGCTFGSCRGGGFTVAAFSCNQVAAETSLLGATRTPWYAGTLVCRMCFNFSSQKGTSHRFVVFAVREQCSPLWCQGTNFHHFQCNFWISMARILKCWSALRITSKTWRMRTRPWGLWTLDAQVECPSDELRAEADSFTSSWHFENQSFCIFRSVNVVVKHATSLWWGQSSQSSWITFVICCACVPPCWQQLGWSFVLGNLLCQAN